MSDDFVPGQRLGDYEVLGVLGAGGMGKVYKARNVISDRIEAMKILLGNLAGQKELADRFQREIKLLASLDHPNIAALRTALTLDNQLVMLMEYVDGVTLSSRLESGPIPVPDAVNYAEQLLSALSYAHKLNVIHRDVKPSNMMLTRDGIVKLMDFGIARPNNEMGMTITGTTLGSLNYMSPEQVKGEPVDARSDLYSFGVSLYEMVTGQLPFRGNSNFSVMSAHLQEVPQPPITMRPDLPKGLNEMILMAMAKNPRDRFQSADAFANALKTVLPGATAPAPIPQTVPAASATPPVSVPLQPTQPLAAAAAASASRPVASSSSHRGLYMALGGLLVVAILLGASLYVPHWVKAHASPGSSNAPAAQPIQPAAATPDNPAAAAQPATPPTNAPAAAAPSAPPPAANPQADAAAAQAKAEAEKKAQEEAAARAAALKDAEQEADQLDSRAAAISSSLDTLRRQQAAQGYGLRGDIVAAEELMKTNLARGQSALDEKDGAKAKEYLDSAEVQAEKIERFLGR